MWIQLTIRPRHRILTNPSRLLCPRLPRRRRILGSGCRVNGRRNRSRAMAPQGRHLRGGRELDNEQPRKTD